MSKERNPSIESGTQEVAVSRAVVGEGSPGGQVQGAETQAGLAGVGVGGVTDTKNHYKCNFPANDLRECHPVRERKNPL